MYNREWGEGVWGKSNLPQKSPKVFLNKSLDPPPPIKNSWIRPSVIIFHFGSAQNLSSPDQLYKVIQTLLEHFSLAPGLSQHVQCVKWKKTFTRWRGLLIARVRINFKNISPNFFLTWSKFNLQPAFPT